MKLKSNNIFRKLLLLSSKKVIRKKFQKGVFLKLCWKIAFKKKLFFLFFLYNSRRNQIWKFFVITFPKENRISCGNIWLLSNFMQFYKSYHFCRDFTGYKNCTKMESNHIFRKVILFSFKLVIKKYLQNWKLLELFRKRELIREHLKPSQALWRPK